MSPRNRIIAVIVLCLTVVFAIAIPYRPVVVAGAAPVAGPYPKAKRVPGLRLHVFNTGYNRMSSLLVGNERPWRPVPVFLIEHPREGLVVFDTGLSAEVAREGEAANPVLLRWLFESRGKPERTIDVQLREAGVDPANVKTVVISHFHDDHIGMVKAFPNATVLAGAAHENWKTIAFDGGALAPFDKHVDLFGDGSVQLIAGGGHTHEDVMALVALPEGPALLAGDVVVHRDWLAADDVQRIAVDAKRAADVRNQIRSLLADQPELVLFPGHDLRGTPEKRNDLILHHPEWFGPESWPISP